MIYSTNILHALTHTQGGNVAMTVLHHHHLLLRLVVVVVAGAGPQGSAPEKKIATAAAAVVGVEKEEMVMHPSANVGSREGS